MSRSLEDRVLALAGVVQAAALVNAVAHAGQTDERSLTSTLDSIIKTESADVPEVFGGIGGLSCGLRRLAALLGADSNPDDLPVLRYTLGLMQLQNKVMRRHKLAGRLEDGIDRARQQIRHFGTVHNNVLAGLADTYLQTAGTVQPRIMVTGNPVQLQNPRVINLVRSLLLGGLRAAVLWRQCGGSRWALLFMRASLLKETQRLLRQTGGNHI
ncbi:MAG TPA: high frequency lysogenization protein HflD [Gammaproteobacteria bacterium]|jgi:high frequency lysogenization protein|nr:high frequency lysogenization protein HflD [Gammaproteobacteria bacterium]